jgi:hypothetical protein
LSVSGLVKHLRPPANRELQRGPARRARELRPCAAAAALAN